MKSAPIVICLLFGIAAARPSYQEYEKEREERRKEEEARLVKETKKGTQAWRDEQMYKHELKHEDQLKELDHELRHHWKQDRDDIRNEVRHDKYVMKAAEEREDIWHKKAASATLRYDDYNQEAHAIREKYRVEHKKHRILENIAHSDSHEFRRSYDHDKKEVEEIRHTKEYQEIENQINPLQKEIQHQRQQFFMGGKYNYQTCQNLKDKKLVDECFKQRHMAEQKMRQMYHEVDVDYKKEHELTFQWINEHGTEKQKELLHKYEHAREIDHEFDKVYQNKQIDDEMQRKYTFDKQHARIAKKYEKYANTEAQRFELDASSAQAQFHSARDSDNAAKEHIRAVHEAAEVARKRAKVAEKNWKYDARHEGHKDFEVETVQLDDTYTTESSSTVYGASAAVVTGLVIGGSYLYMKKRNDQKVGLESSLLDSQ